jgi:hypothetical protein
MTSATLEPSNDQSVASESWNVAQSAQNGQPLMIRYRSQRPQGVESAAFPFLLSATWAYPPNEFGLPTSEEMASMDKFEDALAASLEDSQTAYLMVVLTNNGERDWLWYASGEEAAMRQVNQALKGHPRYPVEFSVQQDRAWNAWSQFVPDNDSSANAGGILGFAQWALAKALQAFGG